jgi:hypothetical protein
VSANHAATIYIPTRLARKATPDPLRDADYAEFVQIVNIVPTVDHDTRSNGATSSRSLVAPTCLSAPATVLRRH